MSVISKLLNITLLVLFVVMISFVLILIPIDIIDDSERVNETELNSLTYDNLNEERRERGLDELEKREDIEEISEYKTKRMINENYISHEAPDGEEVKDRFDRFNVNCHMVGENLAQTYYNKNVNVDYDGTIKYTSMEELSTGITKQFMNSPDHKDNLLDEQWESHGINIQVTSQDEVYVTHKFCN